MGYQCERTCGAASRNTPSIINPGPCRLPLRIKVGGLSTMDIKFGSSAGICTGRFWKPYRTLGTEYLYLIEEDLEMRGLE